MKVKIFLTHMLLSVIVLMTACSGLENNDLPGGEFEKTSKGVFILNEGNFNSGNSSLSYYDPSTRKVQNGIFRSVNDQKLGDTGQSITISDGTVYIAVENSGIIWALDEKTLKVKGRLTATSQNHIMHPRYVHLVSPTKAYVTDLYSTYINIFNPQTMTYTGSINVERIASHGYCSTEEMVQCGKYVYVNCWSYSNKVLVIDSETDKVAATIELSSVQPKSMCVDKNNKLWVITDGGYQSSGDSYGEGTPHLYKIDPKTLHIDLDLTLATDNANVQLATNGAADVLYVMNNDVYRMSVDDTSFPTTPFIEAPVSAGKRNFLYGLGVDPSNDEVYVADAIDYRQSGVVYRYSADGKQIDAFRVGIIPNHFAFGESAGHGGSGPDFELEEEIEVDPALVDKIFEYMPAPGHQVNGYSVVGDFIHQGATMEEACDEVLKHFRKGWMVSLGGQGGYVVAGFSHDVPNSRGDYDLVLRGNPYSYQSEPGIIWVMQDENQDGLPNDTWYELKGSEYGTENETLNYAITYYKPTAPKQDIVWEDNQGGTGIIPYMNAWNEHDSYWQDWVPTIKDGLGRECRTYYGSRLKDTHTWDAETGFSMEYPFAWGYADNGGSDYIRNSKFDADMALGYYKISNAVTADGQPANLSHINFVKVQTAQTGWTPNLGEISTEVYGIWDYHIRVKK